MTATATGPKLTDWAATRSTGILLLSTLLFTLGAVSRLAPLLNQEGRLLRQFPSEDGYLMQTVARNMALGLGMSTAAGTIPTNGTQPLFTFISAAAHGLAGGEKTVGILYVQLISLGIAATAAWFLWRLARELLGSAERGAVFAALAAAVWFASANCVRHSMNCLETALYTLTVVWVVRFFVRGATRVSRRPWRDSVGLGLLLGLAFWARNDAVLLVLAACLARLVVPLAGAPARLARRLGHAVTMGSVSVVAALPWLFYNVASFGHIMPVSGQAESLHLQIAGNLARVPVNLAEYVTVVLQIPSRLEAAPIVVAATTLLATILALLLGQVWRKGDASTRATIAIAGLYGLFLCVFYGVFFGAGYFMSRYLFPLSPFFAILLAALLRRAARTGVPLRMSRLSPACAALLLVAVLVMNTRLYLGGTNNMHFQVVDWVQAHAPDNVWVGAVQSGTLGYFHDRTINLDGKVNPRALAAERDGRLLDYVVDTDVRYLADWVGIARWCNSPQLQGHFAVEVEDPARNLGVLRRTAAPAAAPVPGASNRPVQHIAAHQSDLALGVRLP